MATASKLLVEAGLSPRLTGSEALTLLAPLDDAFKGAFDLTLDPRRLKLPTYLLMCSSSGLSMTTDLRGSFIWDHAFIRAGL